MGKKIRFEEDAMPAAPEQKQIRFVPDDESGKKKDATLSAQETGGTESKIVSPQQPSPSEKSGKDQSKNSFSPVLGIADPLGIGETVVRQLYQGFTDQIPKALAQSKEVLTSSLQAASIDEYIKRNKHVAFQKFVRERDPDFVGDGGIIDKAKGLFTPFDFDKYYQKYKDEFIQKNNLGEVEKKIKAKEPEIIQRRLDTERYVQEQVKESAEKLTGITQSYKDIKGPGDAIRYATNMAAQGLWQIPLVLVTKGTSGLAMESAEVYDQQLEQIVENHNLKNADDQIDREEAIRRKMDKPAEGQFYAVAAAGLDLGSAGGLLSLVKKGGSNFVRNTLAVTAETITEPIQGSLEETGGAAGAGTSELEAFKKAWTENFSRRIDEAAGGLFGSGPMTIAGAIKESKKPTEVIKEQTQNLDVKDVKSVETAAEVIQQNFEANEQKEAGAPAVSETQAQETLPVQTEQTQQAEQNPEAVAGQPAAIVEPKVTTDEKSQTQASPNSEGGQEVTVKPGEEPGLTREAAKEKIEALIESGDLAKADKGYTILTEKGGQELKVIVDGLGQKVDKLETFEIGVTSATDKLPEIKTLMDEGRKFQEDGNFEERDKTFSKILDLGEQTINSALSAVKGAKVTLERTVGDFFNYTEPTFKGRLQVTPENQQEAFMAIIDAGEAMAQENVHISQIKPELAENEEFGVEDADGIVNEPNIDIRFEQKMTDFEFSALKKLVQGDAELAGFTLHPDKKGINLYNISKFVPYGEFTNKIENLYKGLQSKGIQFSVSENVRALRNYGNPEYGATRTYQQLRDSVQEKKLGDGNIPKGQKPSKTSEGKTQEEKNAANPEGGRATPEGKDQRGVENPESEESSKRRKFTKRVLEDPDISPEVKAGISEEARRYVPRSLKNLSDKEAQAVIENMGLDEATKLYLSEDTEMLGDVETAFGIRLAKQLDAAKRYDDAIKVLEKLAIRGTELGQQVNAYKLLSLLSPEGLIYAVQKSRKKQQKQHDKTNEWRGEKIQDTVLNENKKVLGQALKNIGVRVESEIKKGSVKKAIDFLEGLKISDAAKPKIVTAQILPITPLFGLGIDTWNGMITVVQKGLEAGLTVSQAIDRAVSRIKEKEFDKKGAIAFLDEKLKDYRVTLDPAKAVSEELRQQKIKIDDIIQKHYSEVSSVKESLVNKLIADAGLSKEQATEIQNALANEFDKLAGAAKERLLKKYLPKENKKTGITVRDRADVVKELLKATNLGALSKEEYNKVISKKLGVPDLTTEEAQKLSELGNKIQNAKGAAQQNKSAQDALNYLENLKGWTWKDAAQALWYANILSGPSTWLITNPFANVAQFIAEMAITSAKNPKQLGFIMTGVAKGFLRGALASADVLKTGYNPFKGEDYKAESKPLLERIKFKGGKFNPYNYLKFVGRAIKAGDILFYHPLQELKVADLAIKQAGGKKATREVLDKVYQQFQKADFDQAMEQAESEGLSGRDQKLRAYEILEERRPEQVIKDANDFALTATFNSKPVGVLGQLASAINNAKTQLPALNYLIPFVNTIMNVANEYMNYNPIFGYLRVATGSMGFNPESKSYKKLSDEERARIAIKATAGLAAMTALFLMDDPDDEENLFEITANGYGDQQKNYELERSGWRPYSIRIGDKWISYKNTPLAFAFAPVGYMKDSQRYTKDTTASEKASILALGSFKFLMDQSTMASLSDFFNIFGSDDISRYSSAFDKGAKLVQNTAKSFVLPNAVTQTSRLVQDLTDMPMKNATNAVEGLVRDIPILRSPLGNMYDAFGDEVVPKQIEKLTPFNLSDYDQEPDSPLFKFLKDNKVTIGRPDKNSLKPDGKQMTDEEFDKFALVAAKITKQKLLRQLPYMMSLKKSKVQDYVSKLKREARNEARTQVFGFSFF
jgi:hypothetical protein